MKNPRNRMTLLIAISCLCFSAASRSDAATVYDAAADFSPTNNPGGVWSYGSSSSIGGSIDLFTQSGTYQGLDTWNFASGTLDSPLVGYNPTASPITPTPFNSATFDPGQLWLSPGPDSSDGFTVVRFTAPSAGNFSISGSFIGVDFVGPTTTDVHVLVNGVSIFDGTVDSFGGGPSFSGTTSLGAGGTIDFVVGRGSNGTYNFDSTGLAATIKPTPEPSTFALAGVAALAGLGYGWRKRRPATA